LIEDDEDDKDFFRIALEDLQLETVCYIASSAGEAFDLLHQQAVIPDVIFLDLNMPIMDGRACLKVLKTNAATQNIPVVIFSTSNEKKDISETRQLGAADFMTKPTDLTKLTQYLEELLLNQINQNKST
jgi:CheY-like chemotaxis protein